MAGVGYNRAMKFGIFSKHRTVPRSMQLMAKHVLPVFA